MLMNVAKSCLERERPNIGGVRSLITSSIAIRHRVLMITHYFLSYTTLVVSMSTYSCLLWHVICPHNYIEFYITIFCFISYIIYR